jgi:hypothetical protein
MPRTQKQSEKTILWNACTKLKYLTSIAGSSRGIVLPSSFIEALGINKTTLLIVGLNTIDNQIIIQKVKDPENYSIKPRGIKNEETDYIITE